jgi:hypothetical protein
MLPKLPVFNEKTNGARWGSDWNLIRRRLMRQTLVSSSTIKVSDTDRGQRLDRVGGFGASSSIALGFAVTHTGSSVTVAPGIVTSQSWSGATASDFKPADWTLESNFSGATLSSAATEVWLEVEFTESDTESEGNLGTTDYDISGGDGGRGGGGGGGGASTGDSMVVYPTSPAGGEDGVLGGAGADGGKVRYLVDNTDVPGLSTGDGADGGDGGIGGAGGNGTSVTFTRRTKGTVSVRHYTLSDISAHTSKGSSSELSTWVQLATITDGNVVQHHIGTLRLAPAVVTFIPT